MELSNSEEDYDQDSDGNILDLPDVDDSDDEEASENINEGDAIPKIDHINQDSVDNHMIQTLNLTNDNIIHAENTEENILPFLSGTFNTMPASKPMNIVPKTQPTINLFDDDELLAFVSGKFGTNAENEPNKVNDLDIILEEEGSEIIESDKEFNNNNTEKSYYSAKNIMNFQQPKSKVLEQKSKFIEGEAEVEDDEFMNYGGIDGEDFEGIDEYEKDMLADGEKTRVNERAIIDLHR